MNSYPPTQLSTTKTHFTIAQISDLHLTGKTGSAPSFTRFSTLLQHACTHRPDLLLLTGDLCNDGNLANYDWLFEQLYATQIGFVCIAGNHDVTHEIGLKKPHDERIHLPLSPDARLLDCHRLTIDMLGATWQLLLLDSSVGGEGFGRLSAPTLQWLDHTLQAHPLPTLIALHHHPTAVGSAWIDALMLQNGDEFWQIIQKHPHAAAVLCGHVHQAQQLQVLPHCVLLTTPASDRQFLPNSDDFATDTRTAGFRLIQIDNTQAIASYIKRVQNIAA